MCIGLHVHYFVLGVVSVHCVICFVLLSGADSGSLLLEWDGFVSYIECWTIYCIAVV